jgi:cleavage stimulation factor subunit 3
MTARTVLRDLKAQTDPLVPMPIPPRPTRSEADRALVINWKKYLKWEESNPLDIEEGPVLQARVGYALRKCLTQMRFFPELWYVPFERHQG